MTMAGHRMFGARQLLGLGVVLVTILPAYAAARILSTHPQSPSGSGLAARWDSALDDYVGVVAARHGMPKNLVLAVIAVESQFDPLAVSSRGALGLMQLMPATAQILGVSDPFDPRENIDAGVRHLRALMDRFDNDLPLALAAYNAGAGAVVRHRGIPPYRETRQYVSRILRRLDREGVMGVEKGRATRLVTRASRPAW